MTKCLKPTVKSRTLKGDRKVKPNILKLEYVGGTPAGIVLKNTLHHELRQLI